MEIVHYIHINKLWYYWLDNSDRKKYWRKIQYEDDLKYVNLLSKEMITERKAKELLRKLFPDNKIMKAFSYLEASSSSGSRPVKITIDRKGMLKEKIKFREELSESP